MSDNASSRLLGALPPQQYNFRNWEYFQSEVLRFHRAAHPDDLQVIDLVATFRSLMAPDVIRQLGSLIHLHPRYRTTEGADEWLLDVTDALRGHDNTIKDALTAQKWVEDFKKGRANAREFWTGLDLLASKGDISSDEQRKLFWDAHSWERQGSLLDRCPYFDPSNDVWRSGTPADRMLAEQLLCRIMVLSRTDEKINIGKIVIVLCGLGTIAFLSLGTVCAGISGYCYHDGDVDIGFGWMMGSIFSYLLMALFFIPVGVHIYHLRQLLYQKRESQLHERV